MSHLLFLALACLAIVLVDAERASVHAFDSILHVPVLVKSLRRPTAKPSAKIL
jgi:hypothetical protein